MTKQTILYLLLLFLIAIPGAAVAVEYEGYTNPAGNKFPIVIYDNVPLCDNNGVPLLSDDDQKAYLKNLKSCGFNVELWGKGKIYTRDAINKWAPYLRELGMNTIINSRGYSLVRKDTACNANTPDEILLEDNWNGLRTVISNFNNDPNVWGFWVCDEPNVPLMQTSVYNLQPNQVAIIPTFNRVHQFRGSKVAYANLAAAYNYDWIGDFATYHEPINSRDFVGDYENFLDYMVEALDLKFLTFDLYPIVKDYKDNPPVWKIKNEYYYFMDLYGRYCRDKKIPVWLVMLCVEHADHKPDKSLNWEYPEITTGFLMFQAMNGLAFGMKGLEYWQYGASGGWSGSTEYKSALFDMNKMKKTRAWDNACYVNCITEQYGKYLLNAEYDKCFLAADDSLLSNTKSDISLDPKDRIPPFLGFAKLSKRPPFEKPVCINFECVDSIEYEGVGVLLSHLKGNNGDFIAVVNQDYVNSQKVTLCFDKNIINKRIKIMYLPGDVNPYSLGDTYTYPYKPTYYPYKPVEFYELPKVKLTLEPGGMTLFKYKYK